MDEGHPISFRVLARGTPVWSSDDEEIETVEACSRLTGGHLSTDSDQDRRRPPVFVEQPEVARIAERRVTLSITASEAAHWAEPAKGGQSSRRTPEPGGGCALLYRCGSSSSAAAGLVY